MKKSFVPKCFYIHVWGEISLNVIFYIENLAKPACKVVSNLLAKDYNYKLHRFYMKFF